MNLQYTSVCLFNSRTILPCKFFWNFKEEIIHESHTVLWVLTWVDRILVTFICQPMLELTTQNVVLNIRYNKRINLQVSKQQNQIWMSTNISVSTEIDINKNKWNLIISCRQKMYLLLFFKTILLLFPVSLKIYFLYLLFKKKRITCWFVVSVGS